VADPRHHTAWHAEQLRRRRERRAYWLGIGEVYLTICLSAYTAPALAMVAGR
jgi:hypothetical protein